MSMVLILLCLISSSETQIILSRSCEKKLLSLVSILNNSLLFLQDSFCSITQRCQLLVLLVFMFQAWDMLHQQLLIILLKLPQLRCIISWLLLLPFYSIIIWLLYMQRPIETTVTVVITVLVLSLHLHHFLFIGSYQIHISSVVHCFFNVFLSTSKNFFSSNFVSTLKLGKRFLSLLITDSLL